jgi:secreted trypsin-like serine protease
MNVQEFFVRLLRFVIIFLAASRAAAAGTIDPSTPDSKYVEFGKQFPFVVRITNNIDCKKCDKLHEQHASAVVIKPHWALTAAHVISSAQDDIIHVGDTQHRVLYKVCYKDYDENKPGLHDIALCYTGEDFKLDFYVPLYRKTDELGQAVTIAGWGSSGNFATGAVNFDNKRRAGQNKLSSAFLSVVVCTPRKAGRFPLEFMIAPGDSGGGMFIGNELAGINSFLAHADGKPDGSYGDDSAFTRVSLYAAWIDEQIQLHELALAARATTGADVRALGQTTPDE